MNSPTKTVPRYDPDIYRREAILDPYPHYQRLRDLGSVVWLNRQKVYALPRYTECRAVLRDDKTFLSGHGVGLNGLTNRMSRGTTLNSDGAEHDIRRKLVAHRLMPRALRHMGEAVDAQARDVVDRAVTRQQIDGVEDIALALPLAVVPDLVGWPSDHRDHLLVWAAATFNVLGPVNAQAVKAAPATLRMLHYARRVVRERNVTEGSMAHEVLQAADRDEVSEADCAAMMLDYIAPSLDTTISAIANALNLFARHPEQWDLLRSDPALINNAVNEVVRHESPVRAFTRYVAVDSRIGGTVLPAGSRSLVIYASANRDEREWDDPNRFDITRDANRHLGFGQGAHACAGQGLARLETAAILRALIDRVQRIEIAGEATWALNNIIHRHAHLPLRLVPA
ncbi:cytochrome P450 [Mycobacterium adipatum]|uniref:cytochrome P450 n=1 Tax=Mycobacterium adipatum TaxID=1682113 RepID=UPI0034E0CB06